MSEIWKSIKNKIVQNEVEELQEVIARQNREIHDIKEYCVGEFERIQRLCFSNDYNGKYDAFVKIKEITSDNIYALTRDMAIDKDEEVGAKRKNLYIYPEKVNV